MAEQDMFTNVTGTEEVLVTKCIRCNTWHSDFERHAKHHLLIAQFAEHDAAIHRVRDLHHPLKFRKQLLCNACSDISEFSVEWPCETIKALEGFYE